MRAIPSPRCLLGLCCLCLLLIQNAEALTITGYSSATNDRFSSGFPTAPQNNTSGPIFGQGLDWSGVGWTSGFVRKGYGFVSPKHYMTARHFGGGTTIVTFSQNPEIQTADQLSLENIGYGEILNDNPDIQLGTLVTQMRDIRRYAMLDLNTSSTANAPLNYSNLPLFIYGHGGSEVVSTRVGTTAVSTNPASIVVSGQQSRFLTPRSDLQLVTFDSGSPAFAQWTNPNGAPELALVGNHAAINEDFNFHNFFCTLEIFDELNARLNDDGFALRIVGNPSGTWAGTLSSSISNRFGWSNASSNSDRFVLFDPDSASSFAVDVISNHDLRGLFFKNQSGGNAFVFSGARTLSIGRGGITNYDDNLQVFNADLELYASQFWEGGPGGLSVSNLHTGTNPAAFHLEISSGGLTTISGNISGDGSIALTEGLLELAGPSSSYTCKTWIHGGILSVTGNISTSASVQIDTTGVLSGTGTVPAIEGSGQISPGSGPGILSADSINPSSGADFDFEFTTAGSPDFGNAGSSANDLIRITGGVPFSSNLGSMNRVRIFLNTDPFSDGQIFPGGFFTDNSADFLSFIQNANFEFYIADAGGDLSFGGQNYAPYAGPYEFILSTALQNADFGSGIVEGRIVHLQVTPNLSKYEGWKIAQGLTGDAALDTADDDFDRIPLLHEFALGGDPNVYDTSILPSISFNEENGSTYLEIHLTRPTGLTGIVYTPQTTADLNAWPSDSSGIADPDPIPVDNGDGSETLTYRRAQAISETTKAFIRIEISESSP
jgi:hypothetical protein